MASTEALELLEHPERLPQPVDDRLRTMASVVREALLQSRDDPTPVPAGEKEGWNRFVDEFLRAVDAKEDVRPCLEAAYAHAVGSRTHGFEKAPWDHRVVMRSQADIRARMV